MTRRPKTARPRPVTRTRTEEQYAADASVLVQNRRVAARQAFRVLMLRAHDCTGKDCDSPDHDGDLRDALLPVLRAMECVPDPEAGVRGRHYHWGATKGRST